MLVYAYVCICMRLSVCVLNVEYTQSQTLVKVVRTDFNQAYTTAIWKKEQDELNSICFVQM